MTVSALRTHRIGQCIFDFVMGGAIVGWTGSSGAVMINNLLQGNASNAYGYIFALAGAGFGLPAALMIMLSQRKDLTRTTLGRVVVGLLVGAIWGVASGTLLGLHEAKTASFTWAFVPYMSAPGAMLGSVLYPAYRSWACRNFVTWILFHLLAAAHGFLAGACTLLFGEMLFRGLSISFPSLPVC